MANKVGKRAAIHRVLNLVASRSTEKDWGAGVAFRSGALRAARSLPPTVDLRAAWWKVGDQGDSGSCVGWASTDGVMRYHLVAAGKLAKTARLSTRYTWMASKETDEDQQRPESFIEESGTSLKAAMDICRKFGVVEETLLPFTISSTMYVGKIDDFYAAASQRRAAAYFNLGKDVGGWRKWLASHGPILAGLDVDQSWMDASGSKPNLDKFKTETADGGHAICIVGYTRDQRFIVRNSWGEGWGDKGFAYVSESYIAAGFFDESYGVTV